jgi:hypothetical protein
MTQDRISVIDAAQTIGYGKTAVFKILSRLGIETFKERNANHNGQAIAYISLDDFRLIQRHVATRQQILSAESQSDDEQLGIEYGVFYLIQLEPEHDPGRFKVGFAALIDERLRSHRCAAPFAEVVKTWPCRRLWERTAIDCVTLDCVQLHTEVFRTTDLSRVVARGDAFFAMMPSLVGNAESFGDTVAEQSVGHEAADDAYSNG